MTDLGFLADAVGATAALRAAWRLGVLDRLVAGPVDAASLARECGIGERGTVVLLSALASLGVATRDGDRWTADPVHLPAIATVLPSFERIEDVIRDGRPIVAVDAPAGAERVYPGIVPHLGAMFAAAAARAAPVLAERQPRRVLDVGAGACPWTIALCRHLPGCEVTALDLPAVLSRARAAVDAAGLADRYRFVPGDCFDVPWGGPYDLVVLANVAHLFDDAANRALAARAADAGASIAVIDALIEEDGTGPRPVALYALGLLLRTGTGGVRPESVHCEWLAGAGFEPPARTDLSAHPPQSLLLSRRADRGDPM